VVGDGRGFVAAFTLGASGVWLGTAFLATHEAKLFELWKQQILSATEVDTRVTKIFTGKTARFIKSKLIEVWEAEQGPLLPFPLQILLTMGLNEATAESGMTEYTSVAAGQICGLLKEMKTAKQVVEEMVDQAIYILEEDLPARVKLNR